MNQKLPPAPEQNQDIFTTFNTDLVNFYDELCKGKSDIPAIRELYLAVLKDSAPDINAVLQLLINRRASSRDFAAFESKIKQALINVVSAIDTRWQQFNKLKPILPATANSSQHWEKMKGSPFYHSSTIKITCSSFQNIFQLGQIEQRKHQELQDTIKKYDHILRQMGIRS